MDQLVAPALVLPAVLLDPLVADPLPLLLQPANTTAAVAATATAPIIVRCIDNPVSVPTSTGRLPGKHAHVRPCEVELSAPDLSVR